MTGWSSRKAGCARRASRVGALANQRLHPTAFGALVWERAGQWCCQYKAGAAPQLNVLRLLPPPLPQHIYARTGVTPRRGR